MRILLYIISIVFCISCSGEKKTQSSGEKPDTDNNNAKIEASTTPDAAKNTTGTKTLKSGIDQTYIDILSISDSGARIKTKQDIIIRYHSTPEYKPYSDSLYQVNSVLNLDHDDWLDFRLPDSTDKKFKKLFKKS